jgi:hypothetical protein
MTLAEEKGLAVYRRRKNGMWLVASRELARATAHEHSNIMSAARLAERELGLTGALVWGSYEPRRSNGRAYPCCWIPREVLAAIRLHNVPGCRVVPEIIAEYLRLLDMHEAAQPARVCGRPSPAWSEAPAEPAPDSAPTKQSLADIRPPDPEPANWHEPAMSEDEAAALLADKLAKSWLINCAVERIVGADLPHSLRADLQRWNAERCRLLYDWLRARGGSWAEANQIFTTMPTGTVGRVECR